MRWGLPAAAAVLVLSLGSTACAGRSLERSDGSNGSTTGGFPSNAVVERTIDGDTLIVDSHGQRERVRLIGVDTPESVHPSKPVECFGKEASQHTADLLPRGTEVHLRRDAEIRDRYGRLLAYVYRSSDALFVNLDLVVTGYANAYRFAPNDSLAQQFQYAQSLARDHGAGLWSACPGDR